MGGIACNLLGAVLLFPIGLAVGSFLELALDRLPRSESLVWPPSHCRACGHRLSPGELVPIVSYLVQQGRCRSCGSPIGGGGWVPIREGFSGAALAVPWAVIGCTQPAFALVVGCLVLAAGWGVAFLRNRQRI